MKENFGYLWRTVGFVLLSLVSFVLSIHAQEFRGIIRGTVKDPSGAVIQNATIIAIGPEQTYKSTTQADGTFTIPFVQPATYQITIDAPGFKTEVRPGVVIDINTRFDLQVALHPGAQTQTIVVKDTSGLTVNMDDASGGTIMDPDKVQQLPLNGRQAYMLLSLTPGTQFTQTGFGSAGYSGTRGWDESNAYSINGQSGSYNQFSLDGAPVSQQNGGGAGTWNIAPNIDAIDEFKVMTNTYDAQYGRYAGGNVNMILKSGTHQFHGTAFDFWRNSVLDANTYQVNQEGLARAFHNQHQFGGTVGGPVAKSKKAFFFFSFEGWREVLPGDVIATVPTPDMFPDAFGNVNLQGFQAATGNSEIYDPATVTCVVPGQNPCAKYQRQPFPALEDGAIPEGYGIPADRINTNTSLKIMQLYPAPNRTGYVNNYVYKGDDAYQYNQPIGRGDYNFSDKTKLSGTFAWWSGTETRSGNGYPGAVENGNIHNYRSSLTQSLDLTHTFNPNLYADVRVAYNRALDLSPDGALSAGLASFTPSQLGLTMPQIPTTSHNYAPELNVDHFNGLFGNTISPNFFETYSVSPSMTEVIKRHTLHYGFQGMLFHDNVSGIGQPNGYFHFNSNFTEQTPNFGDNTGSSVADLLLGYPSDANVQDNSSTYISYKAYGFYAQDDWKVKSNLTLNLGIRWDDETSPTDRNHHLMAGMCLTCVNTTLTNLVGIGSIYGVPQYSSDSLTPYVNVPSWPEPKIGVSYALTNKLVVRGGYGIGQALGIELGGGSPWDQNTNYNAVINAATQTPSEDFNSGVPYPGGYSPAPGSSLGDLAFAGNGLGIDLRDHKIPIAQSYSFGIQGELPMHIIGDLEYVGTYTTRIRTSKQYDGLPEADVQAGLANPSYLDQQVPNPFYGKLPNTVGLGQNPTISAKYLMVPYPQYYGNLYIYTHADGYQNYNSMVAKAEKRMSNSGTLSKGLSFLASFTWAKQMVVNGYLNNNGAFQADAKPYHNWDGGYDAPAWALSFSGLY